jgi:hypothetical protein
MQYLDMMEVDQISNFFSLIAQQKVEKRSGRLESRTVKRKFKAFLLRMKPRAQVRGEWRPKKLKEVPFGFVPLTNLLTYKLKIPLDPV